jgi:arylsulfatase A-like enzyme
MDSSPIRNVIVLMEDSFRKDHLGCYGNPWIKTPCIDRFARESAIFDFYAEGLPTIPVWTALFTGRYTLPFRRWQPLEQNDIVLAEVLWNKGLTTTLITDTYHMHKPQMGFSRGFNYEQWIRVKKTQPWPYEELSNASLMIRMPDGMQDASKSQHMDAFVGMPDIMPTNLNFLDKETRRFIGNLSPSHGDLMAEDYQERQKL